MVTYKQISELESQNKTFYDSKDLSEFFDIEGRTLENIIKKLLNQKILVSLEKGKYFIASKKPDEMQIAHFIYNPSYISFETALNYYGILSQFPTTITSVTTKRTNNKIVLGHEYAYSHIDKKYFTGYVKSDNFLIATPEKALFDQIYFSFKSLKSIQNLDEYDLSSINKQRLFSYAKLMNTNVLARIKKIVNSI